jgi:hypothetical protein
MRKKCFYLLLTIFLITGLIYSRAEFENNEQVKQIKKKEQIKKLALKKIQVVYPNGGEIWEKGNRYTIRWTSQGIAENVQILLKYGPGSGGWYTIASSARNTGSYTFLLPTGNLDGQYLYEEPQQYTLYIMTLDRTISDSSDNRFSIVTKKTIRVLYPNGGEKLERLHDYNVRWHSSGQIDRVNISFKNTDRNTSIGLRSGRNIRNTGSHRMKLDERLPLGNYKIRVSAVGSNVVDESDNTFEVVLPKIDLACGLLYFGKVTRKKNYILSGSVTKSMKFEVYVQNNGTEIINRVPVMWALLQQPGNIVVQQHEAGFGNVYPERRYKTSFEFKYSQAGWTWAIIDRERKLKKGRFTFVFEVDPRKELQEPAATRGDNKIEVNFEIKD